MATVQTPEPINRARGAQQPELSSYERTVHYVEDNRNLLLGIVAAIIVAVLLVVGFLAWRANQAEKASAALAEPVRLYEAGDYEQALQGTGDQPGLIAVADEYSSTRPGALAAYYAGDALFRLGRYDEALEYFDDYDGSDSFVAASALAGQAAIYEQKGEYVRAAGLFREAADAYENPAIAPGYLLSAVRNYAEAGNAAEARSAFERLQNDFPQAPEVSEGEFYMGMLDAGGTTAQ